MRRIRIPTSVTIEQMKEIALILFFCNPFIFRGFAFVLSRVGLNSIARYLMIAVVYLPVLMIAVKSPKSIPFDFLVVGVLLLFMFLVTYCIHPEYEFWYTRDYYGVWDYVLRPDNGLYAYFFIRLVNDPKRIMGGLKKASWIMYVYYLYLLLGALSRGYWVSTNSAGDTIHMAYDLSFGYDVLLFTLVFLHAALKDKNKVDLVMAGLGLCMILLAGSRGPFVGIFVFIAIHYFLKFRSSSISKKLLMLMAFLTIGLFIYVFFDAIILAIAYLMERFGLSSRTLTMLLEGQIANDNGRDKIWAAAIQMIRDKPFGYGLMGTRHVIYYIHDVGHPHQFFLEILVDFGVLAGTVISLFLLINSGKIILSNYDEGWKAVFAIFFSRACQLLLSGTFWHVASFWACIGIGVSVMIHKKQWRRRQRYINGISNQ